MDGRKDSGQEGEAEILESVLDREALEILRRVSLTHGEKAKEARRAILSMARSGQIRKRIGASELRQFLGEKKEESTVDFIQRDLFDSD
ncbi:MAG: uncharacterized protein A8A55_0096 [Amphiamblys sp. WSBS2006]|nr:MAG: uncharacterized protein A8A55_0096 [Amphiamblys sp. WSBS2006]